MRKLFTILFTLISLTTLGQSWQNMGNTLQRQIVGSDTNYRVNLGVTGFMYLYTKPQIDTKVTSINNSIGIKANDNAVVHKTGSLTETATGIKTWSDRQNFPGGGSWQFDGIRVNSLARSDISNPMFIYPSSSSSVQTPLIFAPAINALNNNNNMFRFTNSNNHMLIGIRDSSLFTTNAGVPHGSITNFSYYQQSGGANDPMAFIYDISTSLNVPNYSFLLSGKNDGWFFRSTGIAPSFTNGDIEIGNNIKGLILKSPDGTRYRITVANGGTLTITPL